MKKKMILVAIVAVLSKYSMADDVIVFNSPMPMKAVYGDPGHGEDRIENGKIVVDSPFDLEIGSAEYSKALGKAIKSHKDVRKDPKTGATTTNWYHFAEVRFSNRHLAIRVRFLGSTRCRPSSARWATLRSKLPTPCRATRREATTIGSSAAGLFF